MDLGSDPEEDVAQAPVPAEDHDQETIADSIDSPEVHDTTDSTTARSVSVMEDSLK